MGAIVFRTVFGGPDPDVVAATTAIKRSLRDIDFAYELDILLHVGGEISSTTDPTGLYAPRVSVAQRRMTAQIRVNRSDIRDVSEPSGFLRQTIFLARCSRCSSGSPPRTRRLTWTQRLARSFSSRNRAHALGSEHLRTPRPSPRISSN